MIERIKKTIFWRILRKIKNVIREKIFAPLRKRHTLKLISTIKPLANRESIPRYIVSLTSYKRRLKETAPYAIVTLLNQSVKPDKVILWVADEDKEYIPRIMDKLTEKGLEICFCEDIKSYKKLIPALEMFPEDYIITADDDVYYPNNWFEQLLTEHRKNPKKIICHRVHGIKVDETQNPIPYVKWDYCIEPSIYFLTQEQSVYHRESVFPTGVGGILYPPKCFYKDIAKKEIFMKLAPQADDIWFWAMAVINKEYFGEEIPYIAIESGYSKKLKIIDPREEYNTLSNYNRLEGGNDKQLKAVIEQYPQINEVLKKIQPFQSAKKEQSF